MHGVLMHECCNLVALTPSSMIKLKKIEMFFPFSGSWHFIFIGIADSCSILKIKAFEKRSFGFSAQIRKKSLRGLQNDCQRNKATARD